MHGDVRVIQHEYIRPLRGDWMAQLENVVVAATETPLMLVAHSLGCHLIAAWAAHSQNTHRVRAAFLVAPPDAPRLPIELVSWHQPIRSPLPFKALMLASSDDPFASAARSELMAREWGATLMNMGPLGHINAESGLGHWPHGRSLLTAM